PGRRRSLGDACSLIPLPFSTPLGGTRAADPRPGRSQLDLDEVAFTFLSSHPLWHREQGAELLVAPHTGLPALAIDAREHRRSPPALGHGWRVSIGDRRERPAARAGVTE